MDALQAAWAVTLLAPKAVIPMHYKTFPIIAQNADEFAALVGKKSPSVKVAVLGLGEEYVYG
jgi:L-ascorbate metabolism protein UlaG (beta-lactamase superfamily)